MDSDATKYLVAGLSGVAIGYALLKPSKPAGGKKSYPKIRLAYFSVRAKAEQVRMTMAYAGIPWEEVTYQKLYNVSKWPEAKPLTPFLKLPVMEVDGEMFSQTGSMLRYVADIGGVMPDKEDAKAVMRCDMIFSCAEDMDSSNPIVNVYRDEVFAAKKAEYVAAAQKQIPCIKKLLEQREGPFFFGATPYYCDFAWYHIWSHILLLEPSLVDGIPSIMAHMAAVENLDGVKEYLAGRPDCIDIGTKPMLAPKPTI